MKYHSPFQILTCVLLLLFLPNSVFTQTIDQQHLKINYSFTNPSTAETLNNLRLTENGLQLQNDHHTGQFLSEAIEVPVKDNKPFLAFSMVWETAASQQTDLFFHIKGSTNGLDWEEWQEIHPDEHGPVHSTKSVSQLLFLNADFTFLKVKIDFPKQQPILLQNMVLHFFNPGNSDHPSVQQSSLEEDAVACVCPSPTILNRDDWCPTGNCPPNPNPDITEVTHLIIHHSATANTASDWAAVVRSIWDFHVNTWGWSDIGYNWLIDPNGQLYEGRGQAIQGAHFCGMNAGTTGVCMLGDYQVSPPSNETQQTLQKFLSWQSCLEDIDPLGLSLHASSNLDLFHISGHRDGCNTECPGDAFYPLISGVRQGVQNFIDNNCETVSINAPILETNLSVQIFPNPNTGQFQLHHNSSTAGQARLFTAQGQAILTKTIQASTIQEWNVSSLTPGVYWLQLSFAEEQLYRKVVIQ